MDDHGQEYLIQKHWHGSRDGADPQRKPVASLEDAMIYMHLAFGDTNKIEYETRCRHDESLDREWIISYPPNRPDYITYYIPTDEEWAELFGTVDMEPGEE